MIVFVGCFIVIGAVLTGYTMSGGHVGALIHPSEFITIGGAAFGALVLMSPKIVLVQLFQGIMQAIKGSPFHKAAYMDLFRLMYGLSLVARREGLLALDSFISEPHESPLLKKCPYLEKNHHVIEFLCGGLSIVTEGKASGKELMHMLEMEISVVEREHHAAVGALTKTADALPGFGIVAAVLGIVITMGAINGPAEEIGHKVGTALVGTFLGILMSYGFFNPLAGRMEFLGEAEMAFFRTIVASVVALSDGAAPKDVIVNARRGVATDCRPTREEMEEIFKDTDRGG
jgi:chemotaxis protein MotA